MDHQHEKLVQEAAGIASGAGRGGVFVPGGYMGASPVSSRVTDNIPSAHMLGQSTEALAMATTDLEDAVDSLLGSLGVSSPPYGEVARGGPEPVPNDLLDSVARQVAARCHRINAVTARLRALRQQIGG